MIGPLVEGLAAALLLVGSLALLVAGVGVLRLPDVYTRLHAASISDTLGAGALLLGLCLHAGPGIELVKLVLILLFLWMTSPVSSHVLVKVAYGGKMWPLIGRQGGGARRGSAG